MEKLKVMVVVGTRPEIIRLSEVIKAIDKYFNIEYLIDVIDSNAENEFSNADLAQWAYLFMNIISHNDYAKLIKNDAIKYVVINLITDY